MRAKIIFLLAVFSVSSIYGNGYFQHVYYPGTVSIDTSRFHWMPTGDNIFIMEKEIWRPVKGYEGFYEVSNIGRVFSVPRQITFMRMGKIFTQRLQGKIRKIFKSSNGYYFVALMKNGNRESKFVHRLVCESFLDNPDGKDQVNHLNFDRSDNRLSNLEWCTASENISHKYKDGRLNNKCGLRIIQLTLDGNYISEYPSINEANRQTGIDKTSITRCCHKKLNRNTAGGYKWIFADTPHGEKLWRGEA